MITLLPVQQQLIRLLYNPVIREPLHCVIWALPHQADIHQSQWLDRTIVCHFLRWLKSMWFWKGPTHSTRTERMAMPPFKWIRERKSVSARL